ANGLVAESRDLRRWRVEPTPVVHNLRGIVWTGTRWIAVGDLGTVLSRQGGRWIATPGLPSTGLRGIAALPGLVVASGTNGDVLTSRDGGAHWSIASSGTDNILWGGTRVGSSLLLSGQE